ncbi:methyl-accepting chemotaxis protein [Shimia sp. R9_1]|uniref:methyl-accepting chemotaxis protein n=1 Tax=Shimia sp. R9_1 TaxID=2821111 RepID=UPI001ADCF923|nr:methyl-accepting chemotaxis protein [Shimia sp. R9_1]MBO9407038.1 methyl-accepting chemotaxis protein [Shimia sp. R9_1]
MKLRLVMLLVIGPLFVYAGYLKFQDITAQRVALAKAHEITVITHEEALVDDVIHELQKERGYSAGFIASNGKNFAKELKAQRQEASHVIAGMRAEVVALLTEKAQLLAEVEDRLDALDDMRGRVDRGAATVPEMAKFYTGTIDLLIDLARPPTTGSAGGRLEAILHARALVGSAKESAGLERATGAAGLSRGFTLDLHNRYIALGGAQISLMHETAGVLSEPTWETDLLASREFKALQAARNEIIPFFGSHEELSITAGEWFQISSRWIDLLRAKELEFVNEVAALTEGIEAEAQASLNSLIWIGVAMSLLVLTFAVIAFERVIGRIKYLVSVLDDFAKGNYEAEIDGLEGGGELHSLARAFDKFRHDTLDMQAASDTLKSEQERLKAQQDKVVAEISAGLERLAEGDLTYKFCETFPEEYASLRTDFGDAMAKLNDTLASVVHNTSSIRNAATGITEASLELSRRSENQAATLEETSAALEELTASVRAAAEGARGVQNTTDSARSEATESGQVVRQAVQAMSEISDSSGQIAQNIGVIDDIAFQTNLLALNAGVEAARAGDAGSGFAVVASEVRALAQKSSEAATEIKSLIGESADHVSNGVELVNKTGKALENIVDRVGHISELVSEMAAGSSDQATGLGELNAGVAQLDQVTQQNAAMAQNANTTCHTLKEEADELERLVGQFTLFEGGVAAGDASFDSAADDAEEYEDIAFSGAKQAKNAA